MTPASGPRYGPYTKDNGSPAYLDLTQAMAFALVAQLSGPLLKLTIFIYTVTTQFSRDRGSPKPISYAEFEHFLKLNPRATRSGIAEGVARCVIGVIEGAGRRPASYWVRPMEEWKPVASTSPSEAPGVAPATVLALHHPKRSTSPSEVLPAPSTSPSEAMHFGIRSTWNGANHLSSTSQPSTSSTKEVLVVENVALASGPDENLASNATAVQVQGDGAVRPTITLASSPATIADRAAAADWGMAPPAPTLAEKDHVATANGPGVVISILPDGDVDVWLEADGGYLMTFKPSDLQLLVAS
jgi:hypothetical protein